MQIRKNNKILLVSITGVTICFLAFCNNIEKGKGFLTTLEHKSPEQLSVTEIDTNEYPVGFPEIKTNALTQIHYFPLPRFKEGFHLLPNFLWMDPTYIGRENNISKQHTIDNSVAIQYELASKWNYYLEVSSNTSWGYDSYGSAGTFQNAWVNLANEYPELPASVISFWIQMENNHLRGQKLGANCYLRDAQNNFISNVTDNNGVHRNGKLLSPGIPLDTIALDGIKERQHLENLFRYLKRPLNCINEEDEIFTIYDSTTLMRDPSLVADKERMHINNWDVYQAEKIKQIENTYRDNFMSLPQLKNTIYSVYATDGHPHYRFNYNVMRKINSPINGHYYSTPDFYPRYPWNWRHYSGPWHGLSWIFESRPNELAVGDSLYSPFVAAGWDNDPTKNMCPAQYLGLMKLLCMTGAEYFYTGFFNERQPFADPSTYIWQAVMPVYAQAITSRYETIFRQGEVMNLPKFLLPAGDDRVAVIAKKVKGKKLYAITGTIQNSSNKKDDAPLNAIAEIKLDGAKIKFEVRRQGSTYIYNAEDAQHPVFYQLDGWHEASHPSRWSRDFNFEAELYDNETKDISIKTEIPASANENDFSDFTSYVSFPEDQRDLPELTYYFSPRDTSSSYFFEIVARSKDEKTGVKVLVDGKEMNTITGITSRNWRTYKYDSKKSLLKNLDNKKHEITLIPVNNLLEIDKLSLKRIP